MSIRALGRSITRPVVSVRSYAPAIVYGLCLFIGQALAWFLGAWNSAALTVACAFLMAVTERRFRALLTGVFIGTLSCLAPLWHPGQGTTSADSSSLVVVLEPIRRHKPGQVSFVARTLDRPEPILVSARAVELPWRNAAAIEVGHTVWIRGASTTVVRPTSPWSWQAWLWRRGIREEAAVRYVSAPAPSASIGTLEGIRRRIASIVRDAVGDRRGGGMFLSMALGYRDVMSQQVEEAFQQNGLTHLLVVSGYQVSMVFGLLYGGFMLLGPTLSRTPALRAIFAGAALLVTLLYVLLIGSEMSASRALVAATCLCMESLFESGRRFAQRWGVALVVMQLVWPWAAFEVGVALTFAALAGIGVGACLGRGATASTFLWIQLSVWLFTTTIIAIWNGSVAPMGLVLNILIAPCWSLLNCVVGLTGLVAYPMWHELGSVLLQVVAFMNEAAVDLFLPLEAQAPLGGALTGAAKWAAVLGLMLGCGLLLVQAARERRSYSPVLMAR